MGLKQAAQCFWIFLAVTLSFAQGTPASIAGTTFAFPRQGVPALQAPLGLVVSVAVDVQGNVFALDTWNNVVVKVTPAGVLTVVAGDGTSAPLDRPTFIAVDGSGNLYINEARRISVVDASGAIRTAVSFQGIPGTAGTFTVDAAGNVYTSTLGNQINGQNCVVLRYNSSGATVVAGNGVCDHGPDSGPATSIPLYHPGSVTVDSKGNLYVTDWVGVRKVDVNGQLSTIGQSHALGVPVAVDSSGSLYSPGFSHRVLKLDSSGTLSTIAGRESPGFSGDGGPATSALLFSTRQVAIDSADNLYVADSLNYRVRRIRSGAAPVIDTVAGNGRFLSGGDGGAAVAATLFGPDGMAVDGRGGLIFSEAGSHRLRRIDPQGQITTYGGGPGFSGDGGPVAQARFVNPTALATDSRGNLYVADFGNSRVRRIAPDGTITTVAGGGTAAVTGQEVPATSASLRSPQLLAVDPQDNLYIQPGGYKVSPQGMISQALSSSVVCHDFCVAGGGDFVSALAFDSAGNRYVAKSQFRSGFCLGDVTRYAPDGTATVLAGQVCPQGLALDAAGNLYFSSPRTPNSTTGTVTRIAPGGGTLSFAQYNSTTCISLPLSGLCAGRPGVLALDNKGSLYVTETGRILGMSSLVLSCALTVSPTTVSVPASAGTVGLTVSGDSSCAWQAQSNASWIGITSTPQGSGAGSVYFSFAENTGTTSRAGSIIVGSQTFTVTQAGATPPAATAFEPSLQLRLPAGFYIAEATLAAGARGGAWGLEVLTSLGQAAGGFNLGGGLTPGVPGFGAFLLSTPQTVTATLNGFVAQGAVLSLQLMDANRKVVGPPVTGAPPLTFQQNLQPGFYITTVTVSGTVPANYLLGLSADFFSGGVDTGGYLGPGITGFGAFYVPEDQDVTIHLYGRNTYGTFGAESMILTLRDSDRKVLRVISPP